MDDIEYPEESHYRKLINISSPFLNYPIIFSLISAIIGIIVNKEYPLQGFTLYGWTFLVLYFVLLNLKASFY